MGSCLSKKNACASSSPVELPEKIKSDTQIEKKKPEEETQVKKEIFIIKHRKSHEIERTWPQEEKIATETPEKSPFSTPTDNIVNGIGAIGGGAAVRTSSCTKEELDAILIQCGRLSRSSSTGKAAAASISESGGRKYSGSKRSYDFDNDCTKTEAKNALDADVDDAVCKERENRRHPQSQGRRRTPSRERDQRSGSRERVGGSGGRRVSRSPGRRSESPINSGGANSNPNPNFNPNSKPGKMVSVPATVTSLAMDKSTNGGDPNSAVTVKRIQVKRNVGGDGARTGASPRARSPARTRASNENHNFNSGQHPVSLSRSNSRKAENSPYRRNPLSEIDTNIISQAPNQKQNAESRTVQAAEKKPNSTKSDSNMTNSNCKTKEQEEAEFAVNVISSGPENLKVQPVTRTRSSHLSRDLDINPETLSNPNSSYTALLLEDIQNFHQKNTNAPPQSFSLPPCVTKACSILEAVADLNSSTGSNLSEERRRNIINSQVSKNNEKTVLPAFVESEVIVGHEDDLMEPSFHKYVTIRRGTIEGAELEEQESSGSNSFVSSQQLLGSSSCWEPNSAESTDRWTCNSSSSKSVSRNNEGRIGISRGRNRIGSKGAMSAQTAAGAST